MLKSVPIAALQPGCVLSQPVFGAEQNKLLAAGAEITASFIAGLRKHGVGQVVVDERDLAKLGVSVAEQASPVQGAVSQCVKCRLPLPLRTVEPQEQADIWLCASCGAVYVAVLDDHASREIFRNVRCGKIELDPQWLSQPPLALKQFVQQLGDDGSWIEKRAHQRFALNVPIPSVPLDEQFHPTADPFLALSRNISVGGLALIHVQAVSEPFLLVDLTKPKQQTVQMVMEVRHCRPIGRFYEIAGPFVSRVATSDQVV